MGRKSKKQKRCYWCERPLLSRGGRKALSATRDHIVPKAHGGRVTVDCCTACNSLKGDMSPSKWTRFCSQNPEWWSLYREGNNRRSAGELRNVPANPS